MIAVTCACGKQYQLKPEFAGKRVKCTACGQVFQVAASAAPAQATPMQTSPMPVSAQLAPFPAQPTAYAPAYAPLPSQAAPLAPFDPLGGYAPTYNQPPGGQPFDPLMPQQPMGGAPVWGAQGPWQQPPAYAPYPPAGFAPQPQAARGRGNKQAIYIGIGVGGVLISLLALFLVGRWISGKAQGIVGAPASSAPVLRPPESPVAWDVTPDPLPPRPELCAKPVPVPIPNVFVNTYQLSDSGNTLVFDRAEGGKFHVVAVDLGTGQLAGDIEVKKFEELGVVGPCSADGKLVLTLHTGQIRIWSVPEKRRVAAWLPYPGGYGTANDFAFVGSDRLLSCNMSGELIMWSVPAGKRIFTLETKNFSGIGRNVIASPNHQFLAVGNGHGFDFYEMATGKPRGTLAATDGQFHPAAAAFRTDGKELAAVGTLGTNIEIVRWDVATGKLIGRFLYPGPGGVTHREPNVRIPGHEGAWTESAGTHKLNWWGDGYLLCNDQLLVDVQRGKLVAKCEGTIAGAPVKRAPDKRLWMKHQDFGGKNVYIAALPAPDFLEPLVAAGLDPAADNVLKPGMTISLQLDFEGPAKEPKVFKELLTKSVTRFYGAHGVTVASGGEATLKMTTRVEDSKQSFSQGNIFDQMKNPNGPTIAGKQLVCELFLLGSQGEKLWSAEKVYAPYGFRLEQGETAETGMLRAAWSSLGHSLTGELPLIIPRNEGPTLPVKLQVDHQGTKLSPTAAGTK